LLDFVAEPANLTLPLFRSSSSVMSSAAFDDSPAAPDVVVVVLMNHRNVLSRVR
jgi:hypothetical protein